MTQLSDYSYDLPRDLVAQQPCANRADARLMLVDRSTGSIDHYHVRDLPGLLRPGDCLVLNDTRVVPARLLGRRTATGGRWEGLFLAADAQGRWRLLGRGRGKLSPGETVTLVDRGGVDDVQLRLLAKESGGVWVAVPESGEAALPLLERVGRVPLPCYIRGGEMEPADNERYQTVYGAHPGSAAAPTAGLHFTEAVLAAIERRGVEVCRTTLHIGLDTFRPITCEDLDDHRMHSEWGQISAESAEKITARRRAGGRTVAVGTTSVRVLETACTDRGLCAWSGTTDLFIRPPYDFRAVDALLTNFHLPGSTLLVLVRTFGGDALMRHAYDEAIRERYRFYSYGDAMLLV